MGTEMACVHNALIRGFNSIYLQAPCIPSHGQPKYKAKDVRDLLIFTNSLLFTMNHHHDSEEKGLFPALEKEIGIPGFFDVASEQHQAFHDGLHVLMKMVKEQIARPDEWKWDEMKRVLNAFMPALQHHLQAEIPLLLTMERFEEEGLRRAWDASVEVAKNGMGMEGMVSVAHVSRFSTVNHASVYGISPHIRLS